MALLEFHASLAWVNFALNNSKLDMGLRKPQKKVLFLVARPLRGEGGLNGFATKKNIFFLCKEKSSYGH